MLLKLTPIILSSDIPNFLEMMAASAKVNGTSPRSLKEWVQSLKKFSTQISESGEMQRIRFFNEQREIINTL